MNTAEQSARLRVAMDAPLPSCCEYHALPNGCDQGRVCPERPLYAPLRDPMPTPEEASGWLVAAVWIVLGVIAAAFSLVLILSALPLPQ